MTAPRGLSEEEKAAWEKLAATVEPLEAARVRKAAALAESVARPPSPPPRRGASGAAALSPGQSGRAPHWGGGSPPSASVRPHPASPARGRGSASPEAGGGLDGHWDRKLKSGSIAPDFTLDLHGHTLDRAHARLDSGLVQAKAMGARVVLLIAGRHRPVDAADRGSRRGAIRAKILDWLAAGPHGGDVAAIRKAHRRHGGEGALYLVLKRRR